MFNFPKELNISDTADTDRVVAGHAENRLIPVIGQSMGASLHKSYCAWIMD